MRGVLLPLAGLALVLAMLACAPSASRPRPGCPVEPADSATIRDGLRLRQRWRVASARGEVALEVAVQSHAGELTIVGFTPFGTRAFAIRQRGRELQIEDFAGRRMGIPPLWVLDALHRARFVAAPSLPGAAPPERWRWGDEAVLESRDEAGRPIHRSFRHPQDGSSSAWQVSVDYSGSDAGTALVRNPRCGYEIRIETLSEENPQ